MTGYRTCLFLEFLHVKFRSFPVNSFVADKLYFMLKDLAVSMLMFTKKISCFLCVFYVDGFPT